MAAPADARSGIIEALDRLYEFEQEPVTEDKLQPGRYFAGLFAGEHVAATEFVIGVTFVAWGVSAYDIFVGLLIGNALAVLTWTLICAPIAVQTRLTLYWYLRRIAGPAATIVYNIVNGVLFCILGGCMFTVSASAVRIPFGIPAQTMWYPEDYRFVLVVLGVGAVVVTLAILGFKKMSRFASVCSPWLFVMFATAAIALLPGLAARTPGVGEVRSISDFWRLANKAVWTGVAAGGGESVGFWRVVAFAWICNLSTHAGLSDMALFRYAKRPAYGLYSAFGMYLGHYLAWICAGVMGAAAATMLQTSLEKLDSGAVAVHALGISGALAVVIAGWTTSNPTLYRAGLAFQAVVPRWPRWFVTLIAGAVTTAIACFPFVFTSLLGFIGYLGMLLLPVGAIVFAEHWIFPRIGLTRYWVSHKNLVVSWPAFASWGIAVALTVVLDRTGTLHPFYQFIPIWLLTMALYTLFASLAGAGEPATGPLREPTAAGRHAHGEAATPSPTPQRKEAAAIHWFAGAAAVAALAACLSLAAWVALGEAAGYDERCTTLKTWLVWLTLAYFAAAITWSMRAARPVR